MKKIISLLSVFAMVLTMFSTIAFADDNNKIYWEDISPEGATTVTLKLVAETEFTLDKLGAYYDFANVIGGGVGFTVTPLVDFTVLNPANTSAKVLSFTYTNLDTFTGKVELLTVEFDFADATVESFTIPQKKAMSATYGTTKYTTSFTNAAAGYVVEKPVVKEEVTYGCTPSTDNYYIGEDGAVAVKAWDVVAPTVDGEETIAVYFTAEGKKVPFDYKHGLTGGTDAVFLALLINAPADVEMSLN